MERCQVGSEEIKLLLGGGNSNIFGIFTLIWGPMIQFDGAHIFSDGLAQLETTN